VGRVRGQTYLACEKLECFIEIVVGIGQFGPLGEGFAVLNLLGGPDPRRLLKARIALKDALEIAGVFIAVMLDEACGLDNLDDFRVDLGGLETIPRNVVQRPVRHAHLTTLL